MRRMRDYIRSKGAFVWVTTMTSKPGWPSTFVDLWHNTNLHHTTMSIVQSFVGSRRWVLRHSYVFIVAGLAVFFSSWPVSSLFQLNEEEYTKMAEYTLSTGLPYKGKDFLEWRYGWLDVMFMMWFTSLALFCVGAMLAWLRLRLEPDLIQSSIIGRIFKFLRLKHTVTQRWKISWSYVETGLLVFSLKNHLNPSETPYKPTIAAWRSTADKQQFFFEHGL
jgi:hypothetical protein